MTGVVVLVVAVLVAGAVASVASAFAEPTAEAAASASTPFTDAMRPRSIGTSSSFALGAWLRTKVSNRSLSSAGMSRK